MVLLLQIAMEVFLFRAVLNQKIMQIIVDTEESYSYTEYTFNYNAYISENLVYGYVKTSNSGSMGCKTDFGSTDFYANGVITIPSLTDVNANKTVYYTLIKEV